LHIDSEISLLKIRRNINVQNNIPDIMENRFLINRNLNPIFNNDINNERNINRNRRLNNHDRQIHMKIYDLIV